MTAEADWLRRWETALIRHGHVPKLAPDGRLDMFALNSEIDGVGHNGPGCTACHFSICEHCADPPETAEIPECEGA